MQFMPDTAARFGVRDVNDPAQAIPGAAKYVKFLLDRYDGDVPLRLPGTTLARGGLTRPSNPVAGSRRRLVRMSPRFSRPLAQLLRRRLLRNLLRR